MPRKQKSIESYPIKHNLIQELDRDYASPEAKTKTRRVRVSCIICGTTSDISLSEARNHKTGICQKCTDKTFKDKFSMELISDLGIFLKPGTLSPSRYVILKCPSCNVEEMRRAVDAYSSTECTTCIKSSCQKSHGLKEHPLYGVWKSQRGRCRTITNKDYPKYGGRGLEFHTDFDSVEYWIKYVESLPDAYKDTYSIDRIDNDKGYEPGNLRWASKAIQAQNTRQLSTRNTSGYRGICLENGRWRAAITVARKKISIGSFNTKEEAAKAYDLYVTTHALEHTKNNIGTL